MSVRSVADAAPQPAAHRVPAAQAAPAGPALTPFRTAPPGLGLAARDQAAPSQRKISVRAASGEPMRHPVPQEKRFGQTWQLCAFLGFNERTV